MYKKAACWSRLAVRSSSWSNVVWMNLRNNWQNAKVRLRCKQQPIKVSWSACCSQEEVEKERARAFDLQASGILFVATIFLKELKKRLKWKWRGFREELFGQLVVPLPVTGSHRESDDSAGWTKNGCDSCRTRIWPLLSRGPRFLLWEFYSVESCCKLKIYRYGPFHTCWKL